MDELIKENNAVDQFVTQVEAPMLKRLQPGQI
jgi:hypothetical protein